MTSDNFGQLLRQKRKLCQKAQRCSPPECHRAVKICGHRCSANRILYNTAAPSSVNIPCQLHAARFVRQMPADQFDTDVGCTKCRRRKRCDHPEPTMNNA
ncbi:hypothetical protein RvY_08348 [Ramazzottius varieornatus]|uniref:Uncharacterized protein n=1 Tax=Ramazzottius varieornatus TaxID=947166 RepID=A0A1D1V874_RAMVA|nr:hypothetical protein RvY_08348 [Ramazzottius varieornatus]